MDNVADLITLAAFLQILKILICYLYIFLILYPNKSKLANDYLEIKIFNIFLLATQLGSILKSLSNNCNRETFNYISL